MAKLYALYVFAMFSYINACKYTNNQRFPPYDDIPNIDETDPKQLIIYR